MKTPLILSMQLSWPGELLRQGFGMLHQHRATLRLVMKKNAFLAESQKTAKNPFWQNQ